MERQSLNFDKASRTEETLQALGRVHVHVRRVCLALSPVVLAWRQDTNHSTWAQDAKAFSQAIGGNCWFKMLNNLVHNDSLKLAVVYWKWFTEQMMDISKRFAALSSNLDCFRRTFQAKTVLVPP